MIFFCVKSVEAELIKCHPKRHYTLAPSESRTSGPTDTAVGYIGDLQLHYSSYEKSQGKYIPHPEGSVFELQHK